MCLKPDTADSWGHHSLNCMWGGSRTLAHNRLVDCLKAHMSIAGWHPKKEARPFCGHKDIRADIVTTARIMPRDFAVDVATISPFNKTHGIRILAWGGGAAASAYGESNKLQTRYKAVEADRQYEVVPVVAEHLGAWGEHAMSFTA